MNKQTNLLADLNEDQQRVVKATHGPVLVLAGAGSGKTRALTYRIAYLIKQGIAKPEEILAVTFTNKAAGEMKERVRTLLGATYETPRAIGTFHALGARILRENAHYLSRTKGFVICDTGDRERLVRQALDDVHISKKEFSAKQLAVKISNAKNAGQSPQTIAARAIRRDDEVLAMVYARYEKLLARNDLYDFDDLLVQPLELLEHKHLVREGYQRRWRWLSIDEYQDTNPIQERLVQLMLGPDRNICVVGDDYQAIYSWRGAKVDHILQFEKRFPDCTTIYLTQNYRSTPAILEAANQIIAENTEQKHKKLWTNTAALEPVTLMGLPTNQQEATWVRQRVEEYVADGGKRRDCVILYRTNAQSRALEEEFLTNRIPYTIVGGFRFYERREVKDALALLQFWVNPSSSLALRRLADALWHGIGPKTVSSWEERADERHSTLHDILAEEALRRPVIKPLTLAMVQAHHKTFATVSDLLAHLIVASGYEAWLKRQLDGEDRWENIEELLTVTAAYADPHHFLEEVALLSDIDTLEDEHDRVTCMTLHASKGLEFGVVVVIGCEEGLLPHENSLDSKAEVEEERRLLYVGMTRARRHLTLTYAQSRYLHGNVTTRSPSRFLQALPASVQRFTHQAPSQLAQDARDTFNLFADDAGQEPVTIDFEEGDFITHPQFGRGVAVEIKGSTVLCIFEAAGIKTLDVATIVGRT